MPLNTQSFGNAQAHSEIDQRDTGSTTHAPATHISAEEVKKYLKGARFPANKNDLVEHAIEQQAPSRIVDALRQMPTPEFGSGNDTKLTVYNNLDELSHELDRVG
jgi:hypothetical protein